MYLQNVISRNTLFLNSFLVGVLEVNEKNPDPLVRGMDPQIRIHTNMLWICNTGVH